MKLIRPRATPPWGTAPAERSAGWGSAGWPGHGAISFG